MNTFMISLLVNLLRAAPQVATDVENAAKTAESPEAVQAKIKSVLADLEDAIKAITSVL